MENKEINEILIYLKNQRGTDFSGCREQMLERRIQKRIYATKNTSYAEYLQYIHHNQDELDHLIDVLTINVSHFFRNPIYFEYLEKIILPDLISGINDSNTKCMRFWSAGCSTGEEPYSLAIILNENIQKQDLPVPVRIFATDIDKNSILKAETGKYRFQSLQHVKLGILKKYFHESDDQFQIHPEVKNMVQFSLHDLLDNKNFVPPDSIFGGFDIVFCRNVLIYFDIEHQKIIFDKLYKSLRNNGLLVLGEAETPPESMQKKFKKENNILKIYRKI